MIETITKYQFQDKMVGHGFSYDGSKALFNYLEQLEDDCNMKIEFDPIAMQSLSFTSPAADLLFWSIASSSIPAGFGVGFILGVVFGSAIAAITKSEFIWQSFENTQQTKRYFLGAGLMGVGGVLAGGCTVGAGLGGVPSLSIAALLALASIAGGAVLANYILHPRGRASLAPLVVH